MFNDCIDLMNVCLSLLMSSDVVDEDAGDFTVKQEPMLES